MGNATGFAVSSVDQQDSGFFSSIDRFVSGIGSVVNNTRGFYDNLRRPAPVGTGSDQFQGGTQQPTYIGPADTVKQQTVIPNYMPYFMIGGGVLLLVLLLKK